VLLMSVSTHFIRYLAADIVRVAMLTKDLVVRCLEVVVDKPTLLLLTKREVLRFELGLELGIRSLLL